MKAIIKLGHALNMVVVAEGVEERAQLSGLRKAHCDLVQGFFLGRPLPARLRTYQTSCADAVRRDSEGAEVFRMSILRVRRCSA